MKNNFCQIVCLKSFEMILSIIVAAYNVEDFIGKCVLSCCRQDLNSSEYEILIVNDGSTDSTLLKLQTLQKNYKNIVVVSQNNSGLGAARNKGLVKAKGDYVWFIDGDDYIKENILVKTLNKIEKYKLDALSLNYNIINDKYIRNIYNANDIKINKEVTSGSEFYKENYAKSYSCFFILKKSLYLNTKIFFKERINMQDSEILPKLMRHIKRISFLPEAVYNYVQHPDSFTNSNNGEKRFKYFESIVEVDKSLSYFLKNEAKDDLELCEGVAHKIKGLHQIVFNHLLYFKYDKLWFMRIINLLEKNQLYPIGYDGKDKKRLLAWGLNNYPYFTKIIWDGLRLMKSKLRIFSAN